MPGLWDGLVHFYDVPWNLYRCPGTPPTIQRETLVQSIQSTLLKRITDDDDDGEAHWPHNELSECTVDPISVRSGKSTFSGIAVCAEFTNGPSFRFIHYSNPAKQVSLLLLRGSLGGQSLTGSFFDTMGISGYQVLNLPSTFLPLQLERYLESLPARRPTGGERLDSFISHVVGKLDITVTAEAPVAPHLKSIHISVPATDVWIRLSSMAGHGIFMIQLTEHLESMTGMKLGLAVSQVPDDTFPHASGFEQIEAASATSQGTNNATVTSTLPGQTLRTEPKDQGLEGAGKRGSSDAIINEKIPLAISEVSCAGFKLNRAGRFTLKKSPVNSMGDSRVIDGIEETNAILIGAILNVANEAD